CSRLYVHRKVQDELRERLVALTEAIRVGDPTLRENWMGPVINRAAHERYRKAIAAIGESGQAHIGARLLDAGELSHGWFVAPALPILPHAHSRWHEDQFLPLLLMHPGGGLDEALALASHWTR